MYLYIYTQHFTYTCIIVHMHHYIYIIVFHYILYHVFYIYFLFFDMIYVFVIYLYIYTYIYADLIYSVSFYISPYFTYIVALPSPCMPNQALKFPPGQACLRRLAAQSGNVDAIGAAFSHRWQIIV
jgi:hypothetical protein